MLRITTNKSNANVKRNTLGGHRVDTFLYFLMHGESVCAQGQPSRWFTNTAFSKWHLRRALCFLGRIKMHEREPRSPWVPRHALWEQPRPHNCHQTEKGRRVLFRGLEETLPRPISLSWSPYGEPFLLRNAWKILSLAWPMVSQSRTLTEIFRQTSALSFSGIFSKTTFNAWKNTNHQVSESIR